jgi:Ca2+:H+ antiporter
MTMSTPSPAPAGGARRIPVLRELGPVARVLFLVALAVAVGGVILDLVVHVDPTVLFVVSAVGILGLAWIVGLSTERLGAVAGPQVGGVLNATFGNIAELIIAFFALRAGLIDVVKASITGSIIGNLLFVLGLSLLIGGLRNGTQVFDRRVAVGLFIPAVFSASSGGAGSGDRVIAESAFVAVILIACYALALVYQFRHPAETLGGHEAASGHGGPAWSGKVAIGVLLVAAVLLTILSEALVRSIEPFIEQFGLSPFFVGVILIPTIGNLAEHLVAVQLAWRNRIEFSLAVAYGSSLQVALFVAPVLVLLGLLIAQPMNLAFAPLEVAAVGVAVAISALVALDGESNWLEGLLLAAIYGILAVTFFEMV